MFLNYLADNPWLIALIAVVIVAVIALVIFFIVKRKPKSRIIVDDEFMNSLIELLGNINNIKEVNVDNGRLKITVNDLDAVNLEGLKIIAESGIFVTGNIIKILFKLDSLTIKKALEKRM